MLLAFHIPWHKVHFMPAPSVSPHPAPQESDTLSSQLRNLNASYIRELTHISCGGLLHWHFYNAFSWIRCLHSHNVGDTAWWSVWWCPSLDAFHIQSLFLLRIMRKLGRVVESRVHFPLQTKSSLSDWPFILHYLTVLYFSETIATFSWDD